jgi:hypothetical protein
MNQDNSHEYNKKPNSASLFIFIALVLISSTVYLTIKIGQDRKVELAQIELAELAIEQLYTSSGELMLAYMDDGVLIANAYKQAALIADAGEREVLTQRIRKANKMYRDQVRASDAIELLFFEEAIADDLAQKDIDAANSYLEKVTNQEKFEELRGKLGIVIDELNAQKVAAEAVDAAEEAQRTEWNEDLAIVADKAIELVKNVKAKEALTKKMGAIRAREKEKGEAQAQNQAQPAAGQSGQWQSSGSGGSSGTPRQYPPGHIPTFWWWCLCGAIVHPAQFQNHLVTNNSHEWELHDHGFAREWWLCYCLACNP